MLKFAERLKELREDKGLTQTQLSLEVKCKITKSAISLWELNKRIPNLEAAAILAQFFGVTIDYLAGLED
ncbi:MAG: helix-turn-helix transcriptional regulator [Clostridia bacterium]|nr:helix-turn-helix transcriptional regulator [Clostridia bacterium]